MLRVIHALVIQMHRKREWNEGTNKKIKNNCKRERTDTIILVCRVYDNFSTLILTICMPVSVGGGDIGSGGGLCFSICLACQMNLFFFCQCVGEFNSFYALMRVGWLAGCWLVDSWHAWLESHWHILSFFSFCLLLYVFSQYLCYKKLKKKFISSFFFFFVVIKYCSLLLCL